MGFRNPPRDVVCFTTGIDEYTGIEIGW